LRASNQEGGSGYRNRIGHLKQYSAAAGPEVNAS
jgi:hypothetical protein